MYDWLNTIFAVSGKVGTLLTRFNHTSWMTVVTPTDRPESVRNRRVIEVFGGVFVLSRCFLDLSVGIGVFVIGLGQISFLFSKVGQRSRSWGQSYGTNRKFLPQEIYIFNMKAPSLSVH